MYRLKIIFLAVILGFMFFVAETTYSLVDEGMYPVLQDPDRKARMDEHIAEAERKNPKQYQMMMERASNNIKGCLSCHVEFIEDENDKAKWGIMQ